MKPIERMTLPELSRTMDDVFHAADAVLPPLTRFAVVVIAGEGDDRVPFIVGNSSRDGLARMLEAAAIHLRSPNAIQGPSPEDLEDLGGVR